MSTKDQTHEAIAQALTSGAVLTHEQRGVLIGLVADDQRWQRECDRMQAELAAERERWATAARLAVEATPEQLPMALDALADVLRA